MAGAGPPGDTGFEATVGYERAPLRLNDSHIVQQQIDVSGGCRIVGKRESRFGVVGHKEVASAGPPCSRPLSINRLDLGQVSRGAALDLDLQGLLCRCLGSVSSEIKAQTIKRAFDGAVDGLFQYPVGVFVVGIERDSFCSIAYRSDRRRRSCGYDLLVTAYGPSRVIGFEAAVVNEIRPWDRRGKSIQHIASYLL